MLLYIFIVCDGDAKVVPQQHSSLMFYKHWFLHFEFEQWNSKYSEANGAKQVVPFQNIYMTKARIPRQGRYVVDMGAFFKSDKRFTGARTEGW